MVGNQPTLSVISPNFIRVRTDKKANEQDTGIVQAYALCEPLLSDSNQTTNAPSEIISREVYIKEGKGGTAIRKFVALKTNKEDSGLYAPYVVLYSDFSAGRKTPLEQEISICKSEKEAMSTIALLKEENIKKGWELAK
jgi:hypothetical protein